MKLGEEYHITNANRWYGNKSMKSVTDEFINAILLQFPLVFIDDSLRNPGFVGAGHRRAWDEHFDTRNQAILLNGPVSET